MAVGKSSKFANGEYTYVCSEPESKKRQLINVWIMPNAIIEAIENRQSPTKDVKQARLGFTKIGSSTMLTKTQLSDFKELDMAPEFDYLKGSIVVTAFDFPELKDDKTDDKKIVVTNDRTKWLSKNQTKNVTFPYTWYTYNNDNTTLETIVYKATILDNKEYLYTYLKDLNSWLVMKETEKFIPTIEKQQSDPNFITWNKLWDTFFPNPEEKKKLDALQGKSTPDQAIVYPFKWNTNNGELTIYTTGPADEYVYWVEDAKWVTIKKSKFESAFKDGSDIQGIILTDSNVVASLNKTFNQNVTTTKAPVPAKGKKIGDSVVIKSGNATLYYKQSNGSFTEAAVIDAGKDESKNKVTIKDISGKYYYITINKKSYWILKSSTK